MIYCIGRNYEQDMDKNPKPMKLGRQKDYCGGSVWKTAAQARLHARVSEGFFVYGVKARWEKDTVPSKDGPWHDLLRDAELVRIPRAEGGTL
jgi:hypothetical protein